MSNLCFANEIKFSEFASATSTSSEPEFQVALSQNACKLIPGDAQLRDVNSNGIMFIPSRYFPALSLVSICIIRKLLSGIHFCAEGLPYRNCGIKISFRLRRKRKKLSNAEESLTLPSLDFRSRIESIGVIAVQVSIKLFIARMRCN